MSATRRQHVCNPIDQVLLEVGLIVLDRGKRDTPYADFVDECLRAGVRPSIIPNGSVPSCICLEVAEVEYRRTSREQPV